MRSNPQPLPLIISEADIDEALAEHQGDPRETIRALLHDIAALALDAAVNASRGYRRGPLRLRSAGRR